MSCKSCQKVALEKERIVCRGFCGELFHVICAKIDFPLDQLRLHEKNIFWMCDNCAELFSNGHFRSIVSRYDKEGALLPAAIKSIQEDITKLNSAVASLSSRVDSNPLTPIPTGSKAFKWGINSTPSSAKRRRGNDGDSLTSRPHSKQCSGTKEQCDVVKTISLRNDLIWIHLSAFHPATTEQDITDLARECLSISDHQPIRVIKLVPKGRDPSTLNFVSFKVGLEERLKNKALSPEFWPQNILFREFEDLRLKNMPAIVRISPKTKQHQPPVDPHPTIGGGLPMLT